MDGIGGFIDGWMDESMNKVVGECIILYIFFFFSLSSHPTCCPPSPNSRKKRAYLSLLVLLPNGIESTAASRGHRCFFHFFPL